MRILDTIVVGAGSAGCVLAARLSEDAGRGVLLLESGPDHRAADLPVELQLLSQPVQWPYDWRDQVTSAGGRRLHYGRGRGVGGSSGTNGGVALRPEQEDVAQWPAGWQWNEMLPALCRLERDVDFADRPWHGDAGPIPIVRWPASTWTPLQAGFVAGCVELGIPECADHNEPGTTGVGPVPMNRVGAARISAAMGYLEPARGRGNLAVRGDSHVHRLRIAGGAVTGVELSDGEVIEAGEVILCAGVVQNPLLLWRSGIGPPDEVRRLGVEPAVDAPAVGDHLTDHFVVTYAAAIRPDAVPDEAPSLQTILRATAPRSDRLHDLQLTPWARRHADGRRDIGISVSMQLPVGSGRVTPTGHGPDDPARIDWPFTSEPANVARLREGWRLAARITAASGLSIDAEALRVDLERDDDALDALIAATHTAFYHGVGTCRMGDDPAAAVVDRACRVYGIDGLRIVDASIIPTVPRTNTNLAVMAVAERAAELIR